MRDCSILASASIQNYFFSLSSTDKLHLFFKNGGDSHSSRWHYSNLDHGFIDGAGMAPTGAPQDGELHKNVEDPLQPRGKSKNLLYTSKDENWKYFAPPAWFGSKVFLTDKIICSTNMLIWLRTTLKVSTFLKNGDPTLNSYPSISFLGLPVLF